MANIKISELEELATVADNDILPIVDISENETKKTNFEKIKNTILEDVASVPTGGTTNQVLTKASNNNFDTEWADPTVDLEQTLFSNSDGTLSSITLNDNIENYKYIEIFYGKSLNFGINSVKLPVGTSNRANLISTAKLSSTSVQLLSSLINIVNNSITFISGMYLNFSNENLPNVAEANEIRIYKVVGYK